jgi:hypothetical protein
MFLEVSMGTKPVMVPYKEVKVATEVWLATALLHNEQPEREDWTIDEIIQRIEKERLHPTMRAGVRVHATLHCVANRRANPAKLRMLYATGKNTRRLYKPGDPVEPGRTGPTCPDLGGVPAKYHSLLDWYQNKYALPSTGDSADDGWLSGVIEMIGAGKGMWADEHPDDYVRRLREDWD